MPVLAACESYKFHDRAHLDAVASNELLDLDPESGPDKAKRRHLKYDVTPAAFVTAIITEHGLLPPSAIAVLIRESEKDAAT